MLMVELRNKRSSYCFNSHWGQQKNFGLDVVVSDAMINETPVQSNLIWKSITQKHYYYYLCYVFLFSFILCIYNLYITFICRMYVFFSALSPHLKGLLHCLVFLKVLVMWNGTEITFLFLSKEMKAKRLLLFQVTKQYCYWHEAS